MRDRPFATSRSHGRFSGRLHDRRRGLTADLEIVYELPASRYLAPIATKRLVYGGGRSRRASPKETPSEIIRIHVLKAYAVQR